MENRLLKRIQLFKEKVQRVYTHNLFAEDSLFFIPFKYIYIYLFSVTATAITLINDYYYLYLIFINCMVILAFKHFYNDYDCKLDKYEDKFTHEVVDNQWIWMLVLCCHIRFCFMTIKEEVLQLNYFI